MGEEKKEVVAGGEAPVEEKKEKESADEAKKNDSNDEIIVIKVDMHCQCEACAKKISKSLRGYQGVEEVNVDRKTNTVKVKGKASEGLKLCDRIRYKTGRNAQLISPLPKPPQKDEKPKEENKEEPPQKDQPLPVVTVVLKAHMHCEACAQLLRKRIRKIKGIESVETDVGKSAVTVKGVIGDPEALAMYVHKKTKKQVSIIKDAPKNDNNKNAQDNATKQETTTKTSSNEKENNTNNDKKEEKKDDNKENKEVNNNMNDTTIIDQDLKKMMMMGGNINGSNDYYWPAPRYDNYMIDYNNVHHNYNHNYQPPQIFSDENPNACSIM